MESLRVSKAPSGESKKDGLKIRLLARDMVIGMPVLRQPAKNGGRAARQIMNSNSESAFDYLGRLPIWKRQHLFRLETVRMDQIDGNHIGDRQQFVQSLQRVVGNHLPLIDDHDAVAEALGLFHIVRGVDEGFATFLQRLEIFKDGIAALRIDADCRLIEQKNLRIVKQGGRQVQTPLHASAERFNFVAGAIRESDQIQDVVDCPLCLRTGERVKRGKKSQIVAGGKLVIERHVLRDESDFQLDRVGVTLNLLAFDEDFTGIRAQQSGNDGDGGRFAGAVRSQQADGLSAIGAKTDAGDGNHLSVILRKLFHFEHGYASTNMDEECTTATFSVEDQLAEVDTNGPKSVASLNRPIGRFDKELPSGHSLLSERCQSFRPKGQNHRRFRIRLAGTRASAKPA